MNTDYVGIVVAKVSSAVLFENLQPTVSFKKVVGGDLHSRVLALSHLVVGCGIYFFAPV